MRKTQYTSHDLDIVSSIAIYYCVIDLCDGCEDSSSTILPCLLREFDAYGLQEIFVLLEV